MKISKIFFIALISLFTAFSCTKNEDTEELQSSDLLFNGIGVLETGYDDAPIILQHENGGRIVSIDANNNTHIDGLVYSEGSNFMYTIINEDTYLPSRITTSDNTVFLFAFKENNTLMDVGVVQPNNQVSYIRDIPINIPARNATRLPGDALQAASITVSAVGIALGTVGCVTAGAGLAISTAGLAIPVALATCSSLIISGASLLNDHSESQSLLINQLGNANSIYTYLANTMGCSSGNALACYSLIVDGVGSIINQTQVIWDTIGQENIAITEGALFSGFGVIKVTLVWDTTSDIDLWVTDPFGEQIDYTHTTSQSGGYLDIDDVDGFGPENIFWGSTAPLGSYLVQAHYYSDNGQGSTNYTIQVQSGSTIESYYGTLTSENDLATVVTFGYAGRQAPTPFNYLNTLSQVNKKQLKIK